MAQLVKRQTSGQVMIFQSVCWSPASGSVLTHSSEPGACFGFCLSFSLCPSPARILSLKNKYLKKKTQKGTKHKRLLNTENKLRVVGGGGSGWGGWAKWTRSIKEDTCWDEQ